MLPAKRRDARAADQRQRPGPRRPAAPTTDRAAAAGPPSGPRAGPDQSGRRAGPALLLVHVEQGRARALQRDGAERLAVAACSSRRRGRAEARRSSPPCRRTAIRVVAARAPTSRTASLRAVGASATAGVAVGAELEARGPASRRASGPRLTLIVSRVLRPAPPASAPPRGRRGHCRSRRSSPGRS